MNTALRTLPLLVLLGAASAVRADGPVQPEATEFEPVDVTDLVNLSTGDFSYTIPLMEVPGPYGGYPLVLSYHAGIGPHQEATWVGLGWTLNPGAINRTLRGLPDDYKDDTVFSQYNADQSGWGVGLTVGYGPVGLNMGYSSHTGFGVNRLSLNIPVSDAVGIGASLSSQGISANVSHGKWGGSLQANSSGVSVGVNRSIGVGNKAGGWGATARYGVSAGTQGVSAEGGASVGTEQHTTGFSISSSGTAQFSSGGVGFSATGGPSDGQMSSKGLSTPPIPLPGGAWIALDFSMWKWTLDESLSERSYGYVHLPEADDAEDEKKFERLPIDGILYSSQDAYQVAAQGSGGGFEPFFRSTYTHVDRSDEAQRGLVENTGENGEDDLLFRFLGDRGPNFATEGSWIPMVDPARPYSRKVEHTFSQHGKLISFSITETDGKTYTYAEPVRNLAQYTRTVTGTGSDEVVMQTTLGAPHATSWLLTEVTGPDYVDRAGNDGNQVGADDGDWGYWVRFHYDRSSVPHFWRTPFQGTTVSPNPDDEVRTLSIGAREHVLLAQVETPTHIATFDASPAKDRRSATSDRSRVQIMEPGRLAPRTDPALVFEGDLRPIYDEAPAGTAVVSWVREGTTSPVYFRKPPTSSSDYVESVQYNANLDRTVFRLRREGFGPAGLGTAMFNLGLALAYGEAAGTHPAAQKLDAVWLFSKADAQKTNGRWSAPSASQALRGSRFDYDYSLVQGAPNSEATIFDGAAAGRLTLRSVNMVGRGGAAFSPPYTFTYARGDAPGTGFNPAWDREGWDRWGSYRPPAKLEGDDDAWSHLTPQDDEPCPVAGVTSCADLAAAWSLTGIVTPSGGEITIEYESDSYTPMPGQADLAYAKGWYPTEQEGMSGPFHYDRFAIPNTGGEWTPSVGDRIALNVLMVASCPGVNCLPPIPTRGTLGLNSITAVANGSFWIENPVPIPYPDDTSISVGFVDESPRKGGGVRVSGVTSSDGVNVYRTSYSYAEQGMESGVTGSFPETFGADDLSDSDVDNFDTVYRTDYISYGRPSPGVYYGHVYVSNTSINKPEINGVSKYEFYTPLDHPYKLEYVAGGYYDCATPGPIPATECSVDVEDKSGIYGSIKSVETYESMASGGLRLLTRVANDHVFSDELMSQAEVSRRGSPVSAGLLGATSEHYSYRDRSVRTGTVDRTRYNVYALGTTTEEFFYNSATSTSPSGSMTATAVPFQFDAMVGAPISTATFGSDGVASVIQTTPAYWKYPEMEGKNMLTQTAQESTYRTSSLSPTSMASLTGYGFPGDDLVSSVVTTWSNEFDADGSGTVSDQEREVWRVNDTWSYVRDIDRAGGSGYSPFPYWGDRLADRTAGAGGVAPVVSANSPWELQSNVTRYDRYSRVIESRAGDGAFASTVYGYGVAEDGWLPVAVAARASRSQVEYVDFTGARANVTGPVGDGQGRTDRYAGRATPSGSTTRWTVTPPVAGAYRLSYWIRGGSGSVRAAVSAVGAFSSPVPSGGEWGYVEHDVNLSGSGPVTVTFRSLGEQTLFVDDLLLRPADASVATYAYDDATGRMLATTDDIGMTSFFEYDLAGRLIRVRDRDRNVVASHRYVSNRIEHQVQSTPSLLRLRLWLAAALEEREVATVTWRINDEPPQTVDVPMEDYFVDVTMGSKTIVAEFRDAAGRLVGHARKEIEVAENPRVGVEFEPFGLAQWRATVHVYDASGTVQVRHQTIWKTQSGRIEGPWSNYQTYSGPFTFTGTCSSSQSVDAPLDEEYGAFVNVKVYRGGSVITEAVEARASCPDPNPPPNPEDDPPDAFAID